MTEKTGSADIEQKHALTLSEVVGEVSSGKNRKLTSLNAGVERYSRRHQPTAFPKAPSCLSDNTISRIFVAHTDGA